ncbi:MAG TPA: type VI secretion system lipoprotein TssJ [Xanthomonadales bacterium]|nr:type VI secretion system lipoprotein TssJ [Xanthomonadales bacterium]
MTKKLVMASVALMLLALLLSACGSAPKSNKEKLEIRISATSDVNPDLNDRPSPVILHILELTSIDGFNRATFFELTENDAAALGGDVLNKSEIILTPGGTSETVLDMDSQISFLGFVAAYRDIDNSRWRVSQEVIPGKTDFVTLDIGRQQITIAEVNN